MPRRFVIGDVHGCFKTLDHLITAIIKPTKDDRLYFLGDYIDRGPASKEVTDMLIDMIDQGYQLNLLRGNHEQMLLDTFNDELDKSSWFINGGNDTMRSFGFNHPRELEEKYIDFYDRLQYYFELDDAYLVHAGFNFKAVNIFEDTEYMLWARNYFVDFSVLNNKKLIHGHTPVALDEIQQSVKLNLPKINLDNGCVYKSQHPGLGNLCCLNLDTWELIVQENIDF